MSVALIDEEKLAEAVRNGDVGRVERMENQAVNTLWQERKLTEATMAAEEQIRKQFTELKNMAQKFKERREHQEDKENRLDKQQQYRKDEDEEARIKKRRQEQDEAVKKIADAVGKAKNLHERLIMLRGAITDYIHHNHGQSVQAITSSITENRSEEQEKYTAEQVVQRLNETSTILAVVLRILLGEDATASEMRQVFDENSEELIRQVERENPGLSLPADMLHSGEAKVIISDTIEASVEAAYDLEAGKTVAEVTEVLNNREPQEQRSAAPTLSPGGTRT